MPHQTPNNTNDQPDSSPAKNRAATNLPDANPADTERDRWDSRYSEVAGLNKVNELIDSLHESLAESVARSGNSVAGEKAKALDIAGGSGADTLYLAELGFSATLLDVSPVGLQLAADAAQQRGLQIETVALNTERSHLPQGPWDVIHIAHYLHRPTIEAAAKLLSPGGRLVVSIATTTNLEKHDRPPAMFLLEPDELRKLAGGLEVVRYDEDWRQNGVFEAWLVAQRN